MRIFAYRDWVEVFLLIYFTIYTIVTIIFMVIKLSNLKLKLLQP